MPATGNPQRIGADIDAEHVARVSRQGASEGPVVGRENVDRFVETAADEEGARFWGGGVLRI